MTQATKKEPEHAFIKFFEDIRLLHGDCFILLQSKDGKISLKGVASTDDYLAYIIDEGRRYKERNYIN